MRILIGTALTGILISTIFIIALQKSITPSIMIIALLAGFGLLTILVSSIKFSSSRTRQTENEFMMETIKELVSQMKNRQMELDIFNENILQSVPSGVISINNDGIITKINEAGMKIIGKTEVVGKPISEILGGPLLNYIIKSEFIKREEVLSEFNGRKVWLGFSVSPLMDRNKKTIGKIITFTDITEFKELQSRMKLRDTLQGLGEMAAGIAHELRNPMGVIVGYANILRKKVELLPSPSDSLIEPIVDAIIKEINLMDRIITDFLTFARYEEPNLVSIEIKELIDGIINSLSLQPIYNLNLEIEPHVIEADEVLLRQAIKNLIQNSVEAMPEGGRLSVKGKKEEGYYLISISDTGKGIPDEIREKIFIPFFTTKEKGTGLGLSIVHKAISAHGGEVFFDSNEEGTTFTLRLPVRP